MIKGLISPILSPFDDNLSFNHEMYKVLAEDLLSSGCAGLAPFGTTGEALSLSNAERINALEYLITALCTLKCLVHVLGYPYPAYHNVRHRAYEKVAPIKATTPVHA